MIAFFANQYAAFKNLDGYKLRLPDNIYNYAIRGHHCYVTDLFALLRGYTQEKMNFAIQELAHIIFFIEMGYEMKDFQLGDRYYTQLE